MRTQDLWWEAECEEKEKVAETASAGSSPPDAASVRPERLGMVPPSQPRSVCPHRSCGWADSPQKGRYSARL